MGVLSRAARKKKMKARRRPMMLQRGPMAGRARPPPMFWMMPKGNLGRLGGSGRGGGDAKGEGGAPVEPWEIAGVGGEAAEEGLGAGKDAGAGGAGAGGEGLGD